ncbi:MAG: membrane integrity-associated transporter subunit PqiC [Brucellaceae bacterium]|nr:membrane integrity-associated transporter subunit PqiC [Brucellaceae bacterium]
MSVTRHAAGRGVALAALLALGGCTSLLVSKPDPLDTFVLTAPRVDAQRRSGRAQLLIAEPLALKDLDSQSVVVRTAPEEVQFLAGAQWSDRLPALVQARLVEGFQRAGRFGGVGRPGQGLAIDYQILTDIRDLAIVDGPGGRRAHVEIAVSILDDRNGNVRRQKTFEASVAVAGADNSDYVRALDAAFGSVGGDIIAWVSGVI